MTEYLDALLWFVKLAAWLIAAVWVYRAKENVDHLHEVVDISGVSWGREARSEATLTVVVPARDEERKIRRTLETLMQQDHASLRVIAVDDRSSDRTGRIMDALARRHPLRLRVLHIRELAPGWLGKTHAMALALQACESKYVLFTDADILFSTSVLRRAVAYAELEQADHLVVPPTPTIRTWGEGAVLGLFQVLGALAIRPWRLRDPAAKRDALGIGAFNLVRREALEQIGGLVPQRLVVVEDIVLARRMKLAGLRSRVAFAPGMVLVHWASGVGGLVRVMTKNLYAVFGFRLWLMLPAIGGMCVMFLAPLAMLCWKWTAIPAVLVLVSIAVIYRMYSEHSQIPPKFAWLYPVGIVVFAWAMLRSVAVVTWKRGVMWRGTFYPLRMLKEQNAPWRWG